MTLITLSISENMQCCRLCKGSLEFLFQKTQLEKYPVSYFRCLSCHSAQTETPYWLQEAYTNLSFALDTGMVDRTLFCSNLVLQLAMFCDFKQEDLCIDFGGGTGLLTRRLRDFGLNAYWYDKYSTNIFSKGFEKGFHELYNPKLITAFEVLEHFPEPMDEISKILSTQPDYFLCSTKLYSGQDKNWWYFLEDGQHVQFYSPLSLHFLASSYNYFLQTDGSTYHLFSKENPSPILLKKTLKAAKRKEHTLKGFLESRILSDHAFIKAKTKNV